MFRRAAAALARRHLAEWRKLIVESFNQTQAINDLVDACRARTWDPDLQELAARIKPSGQPAPHNPVADQIREAFGDSDVCPEELK